MFPLSSSRLWWFVEIFWKDRSSRMSLSRVQFPPSRQQKEDPRNRRSQQCLCSEFGVGLILQIFRVSRLSSGWRTRWQTCVWSQGKLFLAIEKTKSNSYSCSLNSCQTLPNIDVWYFLKEGNMSQKYIWNLVQNMVHVEQCHRIRTIWAQVGPFWAARPRNKILFLPCPS